MKLAKFIVALSLLFAAVSNSKAAVLWVEAESFSNHGGWVLDQQFMDQMGSPYLMAHGYGIPVEDATTQVAIPEDAIYNVFVRTYNWTSPWSHAQGPGAFRVKINGKTLPYTAGNVGNRWEWQRVGSVKLKEGDTTVSLCDLTGFNGRCDAVVITSSDVKSLPDGGDELEGMRRHALGLDSVVNEIHDYDLVVVGGGIAGMCAAATAAREGLNVALVNDRPVLGGNNSSEVRVHLGGYIEKGPNEGLGRMIREFGHRRKGNAKPAYYYEDEKKDSFIAAEPRVTLYPNFRAVAVECDGSLIRSVTIKNTLDNSETVLRAPLFSDCTGDGTVGYLAGADYAMGREGRDRYNESLAPAVADSLTMGASVQWYSTDKGHKTTFPQFSYGVEFNDDNCENVTMGEWKWETGMNRNQISEAERVRDYGLLVVFSNWSHLKNHSVNKEAYRNLALDWVSYISGKRESRRLLGDYILKQDDIDKNVFHEDASFTTTWSIDLHFPDSINSEKFPGNEFKASTNHQLVYPYAVPYRCLYSRNVDNLFMAGRDISVTHVALGTVRVMRTTGMMGEVVGMAAALCHRHGITPRGVYQKHLAELKDMMKAGAGRPAHQLPDNQRFNNQKPLKAPRALKQ